MFAKTGNEAFNKRAISGQASTDREKVDLDKTSKSHVRATGVINNYLARNNRHSEKRKRIKK